MLASFASAAAGVPGSKGHPLLTRFKGAVITHYQVRDFDQAVMPIKLMASADPVPSDALATAEGKVARIDYSLPGEETALEVMRNHEQAPASAGFQTVFQCSSDAVWLTPAAQADGAACGLPRRRRPIVTA